MGITDRFFDDAAPAPSALPQPSARSSLSDAFFDAPMQAPAPNDDSAFTKGLSSGLTSAGGQLHALAGQAGELVGADNFAASQRAKSVAAQQQAAVERQGMVESYKDVKDLRSGFDYVTGLAGSALPFIGTAIAGAKVMPGKGTTSALTGATAATAPLMVGAEFEAQQNDPEQARRGVLDRTATGVVAGGTSALVSNVVPVALGGKFFGKAAEGAAAREAMSGGKALATNLGEGVVGNAVAGYVAPAISQGAANYLNPNRDTSGDEAVRMEGMVGGAVLGVPFAGLGMAGDMRGARAGRPAIDLADPAAPPDAPGPTLKDRAQGALDSAKSFFSRGKKEPVELGELHNVLTPEATTGDHFAMDAGIDRLPPEQQAAAFEAADAQAASKAMETAQALRDRPDLTPEDAKILDELDPADPATATRVKDMAIEYKVRDRRQSALDDLNKQLTEAAQVDGETKFSMDATKPDARYTEALDTPEWAYLSEAERDAVARVLPRFTLLAENGKATPEMLAHMSEVLGDGAADFLGKIYTNKANPAAREAYFKSILEMKEARDGEQGLADTIRQALPDHMVERVSDDQIGELVSNMRALTSEATMQNKTASERTLYKSQIDDKLQEMFGDKYDKVNEAFAKDALRRQGKLVDEKTGRPETEDAVADDFSIADDTITRFHDTKGEIGNMVDADGVAKLDRDPTFMLEKNVHFKEYGTKDLDDTPHARAERKALMENSTHEPGWMRAEDYAKETGMSRERLMELTKGQPEKYGLVTTKGNGESADLSIADLDRMRFDTSKSTKADGERNMGRLDTMLEDGKPGPILDGFRIVSTMQSKVGYSGEAKGGLDRTARMFEEGVAAVQAKLGVKFTDEQLRAVEVTSGGKGQKNLTYGDLLTMRDEGLKNADRTNVKAMRKELAGLEDTPENRAERLRLKNDIAAVHDDAGLDQDARETMVGLRASDAKLRAKMEQAAADGDTVEYRMLSTARKGMNDQIKQLLSRQTPDKEFDGQAAAVVEAESDPRGEIHTAVKDHGEGAVELRQGEDGGHLSTTKVKPPVDPVGRAAALERQVRALEAGAKTPAAKNLVASARKVLDNVDKLDGGLQKQFVDSMGKVKSASDINLERMQAMAAKLDPKRTADAKSPAVKMAEQVRAIQSGENTDAFVAQAKRNGSAKDLQASLMPLLRVKEPNEHVARVVEAYNERISELLAKDDGQVALQLQGAKGDGMQTAVKSGNKPMTAAEMKEVSDLVKTMLGNTVSGSFAKLPHAGEYRPMSDTLAKGVLRISVNALNPKSVAYHESLHALFDQMGREDSHREAMGVLTKAGESSAVRDSMRTMFKDQPEVLKQIEESGEERAAYMFQMYAMREPTMMAALKAPARSVLERIADWIRGSLGIWTNNARAVHIMDYFQKGDFAKAAPDLNAVQRAMMAPGRNKVVDRVAKDLEPLQNLAAASLTVGNARVRDMGNASFDRIADLIHPTSRGETQEVGYVMARRIEASRLKNAFQEDMGKLDAKPKDIDAAMGALRLNDKSALTPEQAAVAGKLTEHFEHAFKYMRDAGVDVGRLSIDKDYAPRVWDVSKIASDETAFRAMLDKYVAAGKMDRASVNAVINKLMGNDGGEVITDSVGRPGNEFVKERTLKFIDGVDAEPFVETDGLRTVTHYMEQAAKRAEWARRFGMKDASGINEDGKLSMHLERAKRTGASPKEMETMERYLAGINNTLGDDMSPGARKISSNIMIYQNLRLLPLGIFSAMVDANGIMVNGGKVHDAATAFIRGIKEIKMNYEKTPQRDAAYKFAEDIGVIDNVALNHALGGATFGMSHASPALRKLNDQMFRFNGMEQWNTSMRVSAAQAAIGFFGRHADGVSPHSARYLAEAGLRESDVVKDSTGRPLVTKQDFIGHGMSEAKATEASNKMAFAVNRWVDGAVLRPDATTKPIWMNDPHYAMIGHMKQFMFAFQETTLKRVMHEMRYGNYTPVAALAAYIPVMLAADMAKGILQGGGSLPDWQENWGPEEYLERAVQRSGLFGVGQLGIDTAKDVRRGGIGIDALLGPTVNQLTDVVQVAGGKRGFGTTAIDAIPAVNFASDAMSNKGVAGDEPPALRTEAED